MHAGSLMINEGLVIDQIGWFKLCDSESCDFTGSAVSPFAAPDCFMELCGQIIVL